MSDEPNTIGELDPILRASIDGAEYRERGWHTGHGTADCIRIPTPTECGAVQGDEDPAPSWGDWDGAEIQRRDDAIIAMHAPGRIVIDGDTDTDGDYLILSTPDDEDDDCPNTRRPRPAQRKEEDHGNTHRHIRR